MPDVPAGAGRAAHEARTARAAQRTPLPGKPVERSAVRIAQEMVAEKHARDSLLPSQLNDEREHSYDVRRASHIGGQLVALRDVVQYGSLAIAKGDVVEVAGLGFTNAGFRGIRVSVRTAAGALVHDVSAGAFEVLDV